MKKNQWTVQERVDSLVFLGMWYSLGVFVTFFCMVSGYPLWLVTIFGVFLLVATYCFVQCNDIVATVVADLEEEVRECRSA